MESVTAVFRNGRIDLPQPVDWPEGIRVAVTPIDPTEVSIEEFEAGLDELASASDDIPILPTEAYTRESIYRND